MSEREKLIALDALMRAPDYHLRSREMTQAATDAGADFEEIHAALAARTDLPRALTVAEEDALRFAIETSGSDDLVALASQVPSTRVIGYCGCGCATVHLEVTDPSVPRARQTLSPFGDVAVNEADGEIVGGLIVFIEDGKLASLEVYKYLDGQISPMPDRSRLIANDPAVYRSERE